MKKHLRNFLILFFLCDLTLPVRVFSAFAETTISAQSSVALGFIAPLTGMRASSGNAALHGAELAVSDLNSGLTDTDLSISEPAKSQAHSTVRLLVEDSRADAATGVAAYKKLLSEDVKLFLTQNSNVSIAVEPLVNHDKVIQLAFATTSDSYSLLVAKDGKFVPTK